MVDGEKTFINKKHFFYLFLLFMMIVSFYFGTETDYDVFDS